MTQSSSAWGQGLTQYFYELTPERVLDSVEETGFRCTGRCTPLNSYENRVYEVELDPENFETEVDIRSRFKVAKFYRPGRWSEIQILEEHEFLLDLQKNEIPAIAPIAFPNGKTLQKCSRTGIFYSLFPKVGGRQPDELDREQLERIGRLTARIHGVGAIKSAPNRVVLNPKNYGIAHLEFLLEGRLLPPNLATRFETVVREICAMVEPWFEELGQAGRQRIHGDCHRGNLLWNQQGPFFLDFDDMVQGPPVQDLWLMIPERGEALREAMDHLLAGYEQMREFDRRQLKLIEPLRALRWIHFAAWIARRWEDPAFPLAFPQFGSERYWGELTHDLEEQLRGFKDVRF